MNTSSLPRPAQTGAAALRHPAGLKIIFLTEMWERFSYYGMRALLVLYLVNALGYSRADALALYGLYTGLVYITPLIGGAMADRWLGERLGWHWGFASAGVGMAIGMMVLCRGQGLLGRAGLHAAQPPVGWKDVPQIATFCAASVAGVYALLAVSPWLGAWWSPLPFALKLTLGLALLLLCGWLVLRQPDGHTTPLTRAEAGRLAAIAIVAFFVIFFWMGYEQAGGSMTLFADTQTDRHAFGWEIPASWFQTINPLGIVLLAPAFSALWAVLDRSRYALPETAKQGLGMIVLGLGFVVMAIAQGRAESLGPVGPQWLAIVYLLHTVGELMLSPVGLSFVSHLAPARLIGLVMGVWLMAIGVANYLAGALEGLLAGSGIPLYVFLLGSSLGAGALLLVLTPWLSRLIGGRLGAPAGRAPFGTPG